MKILVAIDGSAYGRRAVQYVCKHLATLGAESDIHLLHVQVPLPGRAAAAVSSSVRRSYYEDESRKALATPARTLRRLGIRHKAIYQVGEPGLAISRYAKTGKFDLVVMGSHGNGALLGLVLGSVVSKVLAKCQVPVLVVR